VSETELESAVESILLASERPVSLQELASSTGVLVSAIQQTIAKLTDHYKNRGIRLIRKGDHIQFVTAPEQAGIIHKFFNRELRANLTPAALETLAIVVYREPITRGEIEEIRGVNSENILRTLLIRGLVRETGRAETLGRPILYSATMEFLQHFGIEKPDDLPPLPENTSLPISENAESKLFQEE
jgi:segregation and condensation protein B